MAAHQTIIPPAGRGAFFAVSLRYGGFLARLLALTIDRIVLSALFFVLFLPLGLVASIGSLFVMPQLSFVQGLVAPSAWLVVVTLDWVYFAVMESGSRGATLGKRLMGLRVLTEAGERLSFSRASARYFMKIVSALPFLLGFLMALFTKRKQALHDLIAQTVVVKAEGLSQRSEGEGKL